MTLAAALDAARRGNLYPSVILYGADEPARRAAAIDLGRALLCDAAQALRPCGQCRHCRRIVWAEEDGATALFHPDFRVVERDLKTSTSVEATRALVQLAQLAPFEARGQVFVVAGAETLTPEAANALLKILEEPPVRAPRHFLLCAASQLDLLPTIRSRSLAIYLGAGVRLDAGEAAELAGRLGAAADDFFRSGHAIHLLRVAAVLAGAGDFADPRAARPWSLAAAAVRDAAISERFAGDDRSLRRARLSLLDLAADLLNAAADRLRGIPADRLLEGLAARRLAGVMISSS